MAKLQSSYTRYANQSGLVRS